MPCGVQGHVDDQEVRHLEMALVTDRQRGRGENPDRKHLHRDARHKAAGHGHNPGDTEQHKVTEGPRLVDCAATITETVAPNRNGSSDLLTGQSELRTSRCNRFPSSTGATLLPSSSGDIHPAAIVELSGSTGPITDRSLLGSFHRSRMTPEAGSAIDRDRQDLRAREDTVSHLRDTVVS